MIKLMDMVSTFIKTELDTKVNGKTISNMVSEKKYGQITVNMRDTIQKAKSMEKVN